MDHAADRASIVPRDCGPAALEIAARTTSQSLESQIKQAAHDLGFHLAGIAPPHASNFGDHYRTWIAAGKHGAMDYLARDIDNRLDPRRRFPWLQSVLIVALSYWSPDETPPFDNHAPKAAGPQSRGTIDSPIPIAPHPNHSATIARYARGRDYHKVIEAKLRQLTTRITQIAASFSPDPLTHRAYVDTGPILEREFAARAGLGWIGKNTLLIHPRHGSFFLLGALLTNLPLTPDSPIADHCGTCTRCIDACPTNAITPYSVDAIQCLSYHTIENRGAIPAALHPALATAGYAVGCDICQDVCPHNRRPLETDVADFHGRASLPLAEIESWTDHQWDIATRGKAYRRLKLPMFQRNATILRTRPPTSPPIE